MHLYVGASVSETCLQFPHNGKRASDVGVLTGKRSILSMGIFKNKRELHNYKKSQKSRENSEDLFYKFDSLREFQRQYRHTNSCSEGNGHLTLRDSSEKYCLSYVNSSCLAERNRQCHLCLLESLAVQGFSLLKA